MALTLQQRKDLKPGQWLFTCKMVPVQFAAFDEEKDPKTWGRSADTTDEEWELFAKYNDFQSIDGSCHSVKDCGCKPISDEYAKWFLDNNMQDLYDKHKDKEDVWELYEAAVKAAAEAAGLQYEGI